MTAHHGRIRTPAIAVQYTGKRFDKRDRSAYGTVVLPFAISPAFAPLPAVVGGVLIGLAASLFLLVNGRVAGISGLVGVVVSLTEVRSRGWRAAAWFLLGLVLAGGVAVRVRPEAIGASPAGTGTLVLAGILVGVGTRVGHGCTSGHGICGTSRGSLRSILATATFLAVGVVTATVLGRGGAS